MKLNGGIQRASYKSDINDQIAHWRYNKFQHGGRLFSETERMLVVISQPQIEISDQNLVGKYILTFLDDCRH